MAISTTDGIVDGLRIPVVYAKASTTIPPGQGLRFGTDWYSGGSPGASTATTVGVNGQAVTPALGSVGSMLARTNPTSGNAYLARLSVNKASSIVAYRGAAAVLLIDRIWQNSGLSVTATTAQAISPATIPARDRSGSTDGDGIMAAIEWSVASGAGIPTVTLTYTNQSGSTGRNASFTASAAAQAGAFEIFPLAAGDTGVRAPTSYQQSATRTSGTMHLVLFRPLALIPIDQIASNSIQDAIQLAMPRIYDDSVLQLITINGSGTNNVSGLCAQYQETQG